LREFCAALAAPAAVMDQAAAVRARLLYSAAPEPEKSFE